MSYRIILVANGHIKKTLYISKIQASCFAKFSKLVEKNKEVKFPKRFINTKGIKPVEYMICIVKPTESGDQFRTVRDKYGKTMVEKPIDGFTVLQSSPYDIEEKFWIYGYDSKLNRPTIDVIFGKLKLGAYRKNSKKAVMFVNNKLLIYSDEQFDMVICKCKEDARRLYHTLYKYAGKQKIKNNILFMNEVKPANVGKYYQIIQVHTNWPISKIKRTTTRP